MDVREAIKRRRALLEYVYRNNFMTPFRNGGHSR